MEYVEVVKFFKQHQDLVYRDFSARLLPADCRLYGVRLPLLKKFAAEICKNDWRRFLAACKDETLEELLLQAFVISKVKIPLAERLVLLTDFIPKINNWSVCDSLCCSFKFSPNDLPVIWQFLQPYFFSEREYEIRFALVMALRWLLTDAYVGKILFYCRNIHHDGYYVEMGMAWLLAEAYLHYPRQVEAFLQEQNVSVSVNNKTLQKIRDSLRVSAEDKKRLNYLKR